MPNNIQVLPNIMGANKSSKGGMGSLPGSKQGMRQTQTADSGFRDRGIARNMSQYTGAQGAGTYYQDMNGNLGGVPQKSGYHMSASGIGQQY